MPVTDASLLKPIHSPRTPRKFQMTDNQHTSRTPVDIRAPDDMGKRHPHDIVYGFPLPREWLLPRIHTPENKGKPIGTVLDGIIEKLTWIYDIIYPTGPIARVVNVESGNYPGGSLPCFVIGYLDQRPPCETLARLKIVMRRCDIVEKPGWFPISHPGRTQRHS